MIIPKMHNLLIRSLFSQRDQGEFRFSPLGSVGAAPSILKFPCMTGGPLGHGLLSAALSTDKAPTALIYGRRGVLYAVMAYTLIPQRIPAHKDRAGRPIFVVRLGLMMRQQMKVGSAHRIDGAPAHVRRHCRHYIWERYSSLISSTLVSRGLPGQHASAKADSDRN